MAAVLRFTTHPDEPLALPFDPEERIARLSDDKKVKGMFFASAVKRLGDDFAQVRPTLSEPPRFGAYIPFADYSQRDYGRVLLAAARKVHPELPLAEGIRRLARDSFRTFAESRVGGFFVAISKTPMDLLERLPAVLESISNGVQISLEKRSDRELVISARGHSAWADCQYLGVLEGVVLRFGEQPHVVAEIQPNFDASFVIRW